MRGTAYAYCYKHKKRRYGTKKEAKYARRTRHKGEGKCVYPCTEIEGTYHLGQFHPEVAVGNKKRSDPPGPRLKASPMMMPKKKLVDA